jgi:hypothetical protein
VRFRSLLLCAGLTLLCDAAMSAQPQSAQQIGSFGVSRAADAMSDADRSFLYTNGADNSASIGTRQRGGACETGHWIESVSSDGKIIKLEDQSLWKVDDVDTVTSMIWLPISEVTICGSKMINVDDDETISVSRVAPTISPRSATSSRSYVIQASTNDETFVINDNVFNAKTYCSNFNKGDRVIFISGSAAGACASQLLNVRTSKTCNVWCE